MRVTIVRCMALTVLGAVLTACGAGGDDPRCPPNGGGLTWSYCGQGSSGAVCCADDAPYWCPLDNYGYRDRCLTESERSTCAQAATSCR